MIDLESIEKLTALLTHGGPAVLSALLLVALFFMRKDLKESRRREVELENRIFEISTSYSRTVRKFEAGSAQTRELLTRIFDKL